MLIDWFTVVAQVVNFLVLIALLKRFLYRPILNAIDAREKRVADELATADERYKEAEERLKDYERKRQELDAQAQAFLDKARDNAEQEREAKQQALWEELRAQRHKQQQAMRRELLALRERIRRMVSEEVYAIARRALTDLADSELESRLIDTWVKRLQALSPEERENWRQGLGEGDGLDVRTGWPLSDSGQERVRQALEGIWGGQVRIDFHTSKSLVCGIEVVASGRKVAWSLDEYLKQLEERVDDLLLASEQEKADDQPEADQAEGKAPAASQESAS
ncbi:hypothetical protein QQM79_15900 [Marinobacteraceae bacterium S3BR75-40.1]